MKVGALTRLQPLEIVDRDTDVFDAQQLRFLKNAQSVVDTLTRKSRKVPDFFLRDLQIVAGTRIKLRVEK